MRTVVEMDALLAPDAAELLRSCCGAARWVKKMLRRRPFRTLPALLSAANEEWMALDPLDWLEAFAHHPRIGETRSVVAQADRAREWSAREQSGVGAADDTVRRQLAEANATYESLFGHICIICATGRSAAEMVAITQSRLTNTTDDELRLCAEEQSKITRLRLEKLFYDETGAPRR